MHCFECGNDSSSIMHMSNGGRICPKCYVKFIDGDYEPLAFQVAEWEQKFLEEYEFATPEDEEDYDDGEL
jgi:hypothetical protein